MPRSRTSNRATKHVADHAYANHVVLSQVRQRRRLLFRHCRPQAFLCPAAAVLPARVALQRKLQPRLCQPRRRPQAMYLLLSQVRQRRQLLIAK